MSWHCSADSMAAMVAKLKQHGIVKTPSVEAAMLATDRKFFVRSNAYQDSPQRIGYGATISAPHMHAYALELLSSRLVPGAVALDVGSGSGYLAACMAIMVGETGRVYGIEHIKELVDMSIESVQRWNASLLDAGRLSLQTVDGFNGLPEHAPYDAIHVGAAAEELPRALLDQLKPGGLLMCPVGPEFGEQEVVVARKREDGDIDAKRIMGVRYVPLTSREHQMERARALH